MLIDKNLLFDVGSIRNVDLYVKKILTTKCGVLQRWPLFEARSYIHPSKEYVHLLVVSPAKWALSPQFRQTCPITFIFDIRHNVKIERNHPRNIPGRRK